LKNICNSGVATHILIMGDFNYPHMIWSTGYCTSAADSMFMDTVNDCFLYQHVTCPTRARPNQTSNILDLVFTNEEGMLSKVEIMAPLGKSDHAVLSFYFHCYVESELLCVQHRNYNKGDYQNLRRELSIDWEELLNPLCNNAEAQFTVFHRRLTEAVDKWIPTVNMNRNAKHRRPSLDIKVRKLIRRKNRLWTRYMETHEIIKYKEYCKCRNRVRAITRLKRKEYELQIASKSRDEPKLFWKYANSRLKTRSSIPDLYTSSDHKQHTTNDQEKVETLSKFFGSVFTEKITDVIPELLDSNIYYEMQLPDINTTVVEKILRELKVSKSPGPDGIYPRILKEFATELADPLAKIFKASIDSGQLPSYWKIAKVTPIFKKGDKKDPSNYRPVSLTSIVSKVLEKIVRDSMIDHLRNSLDF